MSDKNVSDMTDQEIRELAGATDPVDDYLTGVRELEQAAVKGPWQVQMEGCECGGEFGCQHGRYPYALVLPEPWKSQMSDGTPIETRDYNYSYSEIAELPEATAEFIAAARSAVPRLLATVEAALWLTRDTDGNYLSDDAEIPVGEFRRVVTAALRGEAGNGS